MNKADYSKKRISEALIHLLQNNSIEDISIKDLVEEAKVSRSAFYNNYKSIEDVLKETYRKAHHDCFGNKFQDLQYQLSDEYILDFINFFDEYTDLLLAIFKWNLIEYIAKYNTDYVLNCLNTVDNDFVHTNKEYFMIYYSNTCFSICRYWIYNGKKESKQELFNIIKHLEKKDF